MTMREQLGLGRTGIWEELLHAKEAEWLKIVASHDAPREDWQQFAMRGALSHARAASRFARRTHAWFRVEWLAPGILAVPWWRVI